MDAYLKASVVTAIDFSFDNMHGIEIRADYR